MADNTQLNQKVSDGDIISTDDVSTLNGNASSGVKVQRVKVGFGNDNSYRDASADFPLPVTGNFTEANSAAILARLPNTVTTVPPNNAAAQPIRVVGEDITTARFALTGTGLLTTEMVLLNQGTGVGVTQGTGSLVVTAGTTANASFLARSTSTWQGSISATIETLLSTRIAQNNFAIILGDLIAANAAFIMLSATSVQVTIPGHFFTSQHVGQGMFLGGVSLAGTPEGRFVLASVVDANTVTFTVVGWPSTGSGTLTVFGRQHIKLLFNGTVATTAQYATQASGWANADAPTTTISTAAAVLFNLHQSGRQSYLSDAATTATTTPNLTLRASSNRNIPDDNTELHLFLWSYNGTSAPAGNTSWTIGHWAVEKFANTPVYIQGSRPMGTQPPLAVALPGTQAVSFTQPALVAGTATIGGAVMVPRATASGATVVKVNSAASTNATLLKASAGQVLTWQITNNAAYAVFIKFVNLATTPVPGTSAVVWGLQIPAGGVLTMPEGSGFPFSTGIGFFITRDNADSGTTPVAQGDVYGMMTYI